MSYLKWIGNYQGSKQRMGVEEKTLVLLFLYIQAYDTIQPTTL